MKTYEVHISIPGTYEGLAVYIDADNENEAGQRVTRLLKVARENPNDEARIVVRGEQSQ